mgnify:FL=1|jgi:hypothetical protein
MNEQELLDRIFTAYNTTFMVFFRNTNFVIDQDAKTINMPEQTYTINDMQVLVNEMESNINLYESQWEDGNVPEEYKSTLRWVKDQVDIFKGWIA